MSAIEYDASDGRVSIWLNRPDRMNSTTEAIENELAQNIRRGGEEGRVIVISGRGEAFCAGFDLKEPVVTDEMRYDEVKRVAEAFQSRTRAIREVPVPVIARVNGAAIGGGCDLALACDFRIASDEAVFGEPFTMFGGVSADGGTYLLPRVLGEMKTKELMLLGKRLTGKEAETFGLVNETVSEDELDEVVDEYVDILKEKAPTTMGQMKRLINESLDQDINSHFTNIYHAQLICLQTNEMREARSAFNENRDPDFN